MTRSGGLYRAFGLDFQSALALPELASGGQGGDVEVARGPAPRPDGLATVDKGVAAGPHDFWMDVPGVARFHVAGGGRITVELAPGTSEAEARAYLLGSCIGALLHQRGILPLHAGAVEIGGRAVLFAGTSGAGKSTLALHLVERGHRLIGDDIAAIDPSGTPPRVWPGPAGAKLWRDALGSAGRDPAGLDPVLARLDKFRLPMSHSADATVEIAAILILAKGEPGSDPRLLPVGGAAAVAALVANTFRGQLVAPMDRSRAHFDQCVALAAATPVMTLERGWDLAGMPATCAAVERVAEAAHSR